MQEHVRGTEFYAEMNRRRDFGVVRLIGNVNTESIFFLLEMIEALVSEYYNEIVLEISSPGGELAPLQRYIASIDQFRKRNIRLITQGYDQVASAAAIILSSGDVRLVSDTCLLLYHSSRLPSANDVTARNARAITEELTHLDKWMTQVLLKHTGLNEEIISAEVGNEQPIDLKKAECLNFIDKVGDYREQIDLDKARFRSRESFQDILRFSFPDGVKGEKVHTTDCEAYDALDYAIGRLPKALGVVPIREWTNRETAKETIRQALEHEREAVEAAEILRKAIGGPEHGRFPARQDEAVPPGRGHHEDERELMRIAQFRDLIPPHGAIHQREIVRHFLALGETGSGKTRSMIEPILEGLIRFKPRLPENKEGASTSLFVVDPKAELYHQLEAIVDGMTNPPKLTKVSLKIPDSAEFDSMQRILVNFDPFPENTALDERTLPRDTAAFEPTASRLIAKAASLDPNNILNQTTGRSDFTRDAGREIGYLLEGIVEALIWFRKYPNLVGKEWRKINKMDLEDLEKSVFQGSHIDEYFSSVANSTVYARFLENTRTNEFRASNDGNAALSQTPDAVTDTFPWLPRNESVVKAARDLMSSFQDALDAYKVNEDSESSKTESWDSPIEENLAFLEDDSLDSPEEESWDTPEDKHLERAVYITHAEEEAMALLEHEGLEFPDEDYSDWNEEYLVLEEESLLSLMGEKVSEDISTFMRLNRSEFFSPRNEDLVNADFDFIFLHEAHPKTTNIETVRSWRSLLDDEGAAPSLCARMDKGTLSICHDSKGLCDYQEDATTWINDICKWWETKSEPQRQRLCASLPVYKQIGNRLSYDQHVRRLLVMGVDKQVIPKWREFEQRVCNFIMLYFCGFVWTFQTRTAEKNAKSQPGTTLGMDPRTWRFARICALPSAEIRGSDVVEAFKEFDSDFLRPAPVVTAETCLLDLIRQHQVDLISAKWRGKSDEFVKEDLVTWLKSPEENIFSIIARWIYPLFSKPKSGSPGEQGEDSRDSDTAAGPAVQKIVTSLENIRRNFSKSKDGSHMMDKIATHQEIDRLIEKLERTRSGSILSSYIGDAVSGAFMQAIRPFTGRLVSTSVFFGIDCGVDVGKRVSVDEIVDQPGKIHVFSPSSTTMTAEEELIVRAAKAHVFERIISSEQRANMLERNDGAKHFVAYVADEFQRFITVGDDHGEQSFIDRCRSYGVACVFATQSLASLRYTLGNDENARSSLDIVLANIGNKAFFRSTDPETIRYLTELLGNSEVSKFRGLPLLEPGACWFIRSNGTMARRRILLDEDSATIDV